MTWSALPFKARGQGGGGGGGRQQSNNPHSRDASSPTSCMSFSRFYNLYFSTNKGGQRKRSGVDGVISTSPSGSLKKNPQNPIAAF